MKNFLKNLRILQLLQSKIYKGDIVTSKANHQYTVLNVSNWGASHVKDARGCEISVHLERSKFIKQRWLTVKAYFNNLLNRSMTNGNKK